MRILFGEQLRRLRIEKGVSQQQLAEMIHVDRSAIARWETGSRLPDVAMISLLSASLGVDVAELLHASKQPDERPRVMLVDDERIILNGEIRVLKEVMPNAEIYGFTEPNEAIDFARKNKVQISFLDIEMGLISGLDVCRTLLKADPQMNVIFLTSYEQYALDAWDTGACGFLLKPLSEEAVRKKLGSLRWPMGGF